MSIAEKFRKSIENKKRRCDFRKSFNQKFDIEPYFSKNYNLSADLDLITISFNSPEVVLRQIKLIKKFLIGNYRHIICDNSTSQKDSEQIKKYCLQNDVTYIRVQDRTKPKGYSDSHGIALNWVWKNIVRKRKNNFAFLDHDIYPIKEIDISSYVDKEPIFGKYRILDGGIWYLWAGFAFFNFEYIKNLPLNFKKFRYFGIFKKKFADTGSANWNCLYKKLDRKSLKPCSDEVFELKEDNTLIKNKNGKITVNCLANRSWLHIFDGANRYNNNSNKISRVLKYLDTL